MIRTDGSFDQANTWTTLNGFWLRGQFYPAIQGADDPASEESGTSTEEENPGGTGTETPPPEGKTFTQDEVNSLVAREVAQKTRGKLSPEELGFESAKQMRDWVSQMRDRAESDKTEADKEREKAISDAAKAARDEVLSKAQQIALKAEFKILAHDAGVAFTDDAFVVAQTLDLWKGVEVDEEGAITGLDEAFFTSLKEAKPFLFKQETKEETPPPRTPGIGAGGGTGAIKPDRAAELTETYPGLRSRGYGTTTQAGQQ